MVEVRDIKIGDEFEWTTVGNEPSPLGIDLGTRVVVRGREQRDNEREPEPDFDVILLTRKDRKPDYEIDYGGWGGSWFEKNHWYWSPVKYVDEWENDFIVETV